MDTRCAVLRRGESFTKEIGCVLGGVCYNVCEKSFGMMALNERNMKDARSDDWCRWRWRSSGS